MRESRVQSRFSVQIRLVRYAVKPDPFRNSRIMWVGSDVYIAACHLSEGSHFSGMGTYGGLGYKRSSHNASEASNLSDLVTQDFMYTSVTQNWLHCLTPIHRQYHMLTIHYQIITGGGPWQYVCMSYFTSTGITKGTRQIFHGWRVLWWAGIRSNKNS